jgi:Flp pilus assembly protein TadG
MIRGHRVSEDRGQGRFVARNSEHGASAVEFALILPLLVLFLFGTTTFGLAFARAQGMEAAAREGARLASIGRTVTYADVVGAVRGTGVPTIEAADISVQVNGGAGGGWCGDTTDFVTVRVSVDPDAYSLPIPLFRDVATDYAATGTFRCEAPHE